MPTVDCPKCTFPNSLEKTVCGRCGAPLPVRRPAAPEQGIQFRRGQTLAKRYTVLEMIGRGGMGAIYKVHDTTLNEDVALKTLLPQFLRDKMVVDRFYNEARIARQLSHPNIVRVHDIGIADNIMYISMEFLKGKSLRHILDDLAPGQRLPITTTLGIIDQLCAALEYAHQYTIHRDIKPENVMVAESGNVKLMDFGISKLMANTRFTATSVVMGTPYYMSPEQLKDSSQVDVRADVYSLGVMMYEIITGNLPTGVPRPASQIMQDVPPALDPIVSKCLEPDPEHRYQTIHELREAVQPIIQMLAGGSRLRGKPRTTIAGQSPPWLRRAVGLVLMTLLAVGMVGGLYALEQRRREALAAIGGQGGSLPVAGPEALIVRLEPRIEAARERAAAVVGDSEGPGKYILGQADAFWKQAQSAAEQADPAAEDSARRALHCLLGLTVWANDESMAFIPPGEVSLTTDAGTRTVFVEAFLMDKTEATAGQYFQFLGSLEEPWRQPPVIGDMTFPIVNVAFFDALAFASWQQKSLPSESQWARAAFGAPQSGAFPWGDAWDPEKANMVGDTDGFPGLAPVRSFESDKTYFGCYDLTGNVSEWTRTSADGSDDPQTFTFGSRIVVRGGNAQTGADATLRSARYSDVLFESFNGGVGIRCVKELPQSIATLERLLAQ